ncbi:hypothetical protein [Halostagnicola bangensis]
MQNYFLIDGSVLACLACPIAHFHVVVFDLCKHINEIDRLS